jgi:hypothetical protein
MRIALVSICVVVLGSCGAPAQGPAPAEPVRASLVEPVKPVEPAQPVDPMRFPFDPFTQAKAWDWLVLSGELKIETPGEGTTRHTALIYYKVTKVDDGGVEIETSNNYGDRRFHPAARRRFERGVPPLLQRSSGPPTTSRSSTSRSPTPRAPSGEGVRVQEGRFHPERADGPRGHFGLVRARRSGAEPRRDARARQR